MKRTITTDQQTEIRIPVVGLSQQDIAWIQRRAQIPLCSMRIIADLQQLSDDIRTLNEQHNKTISKIRECVGVPFGVSVIK